MGSIKFDISFMYGDNIHELKTILTYKGFYYLNGGRFAFGWHKVSSIDKNIFWVGRCFQMQRKKTLEYITCRVK